MSAAATSVWPLTTAAGIALLLFGVLGGMPFVVAGAVCLVLGIGGWIAQLRAEAASPAAEDGADPGGEQLRGE
jgi:hypothetical protein